MNQEPSRRHAAWFLVSLGAVAAVVLATGLCVLAHPQLEPDDYRFLSLLQDLAAGRTTFWRAAVVENRWDHLWWVDTDAVVRFFRPTLIASYWFDVTLFGASPEALLRTNLALHLLACGLVTALLFRLSGPGLSTAGAAVLFAAFACHCEVVWYVAGRNETLAAIGFLGALLLHGAPSQRARWRWLALPCFLVALLAKELVIALPLLCVLWDVQVSRRSCGVVDALRRDRWLWAGHAACILGYAIARTAVLGSLAGDTVYPYFVAPGHPGFLAHLVTGVRNYVENLGLAQLTPPFLRPEQYAAVTSATGSLLVVAAIAATAWLLRAERRAWFTAALALLTWLPSSVVYISERYVYLPSLALAAWAALVVQRAAARLRPWLALLLAAWCAHQAYWAFQKDHDISHRLREAQALHELLATSPDTLRGARTVCLLDFPSNTVHAQFVQDQLRVETGRPDLVVHVLTTLAPDGARTGELGVTRIDERTIEVGAPGQLMKPDAMLFPGTPLTAGTVVARQRLPFRVEVVDGDGTAVRRLRFTFDRPLGDHTFVRWQPVAPVAGPVPSHWLRHGRFTVLLP
ncbi:MAG: hypothetical protein WAT39_06765 [Planctomycetota bacterium]